VRVLALASLLGVIALAPHPVVRAAIPSVSADNLKFAIEADLAQLERVLPNPRVLERPDARNKLAPAVTPELRTLDDDVVVLQAFDAEAGKAHLWDRTIALALLTVLGDKNAPTELAQMVRSRSPDESHYGLQGQLIARWMLVIDNADEQAKIVDDLGKLDAAHPESEILTSATSGFISTAATPELKARLREMALAMNNPEVARFKARLAAQAELLTDAGTIENRPLVLTGNTIDGADFSTAAWRGKVILVDFWAVWCAPCVGELPRVQKLYGEFHGKGLEVLGVSNDYDNVALKKFIAEKKLAWPELFDPVAAAKQQWNPVTRRLGIEGLPAMFLIDRRGICRTVSARSELEILIPKLLAEPSPAESNSPEH